MKLHGLILLALLPAVAFSQGIVASAVPPTDPFYAVAKRVAKHDQRKLIVFDPADLESLGAQLEAASPAYVIFVLRPDQLDFDLGRQILRLATEMDADPFVDFDYGFITGSTAKAAMAFAKRIEAARRKRMQPSLARVCGGADRYVEFKRIYGLRDEGFPVWTVNLNEDARDFAGKKRQAIKKAAKQSTLLFVGHGWPDGVVGGPVFSDLEGAKFPGRIAFNVACYTGVTHAYYDRDPRTGRPQRKLVPEGESFALALIDTGIVGYSAFLCPRPAGPELDTDIVRLMTDGDSLGAVRRRDYDKTVLGFMGYGHERLNIGPWMETAPFPARDAVRDMMLEGATGGILFGDPTLRPFRAHPDRAPVRCEVKSAGSEVNVDLHVESSQVFLHCADQTAYFPGTKQMSLRMYARVPLGKRGIESVEVLNFERGGRAEKHHLIWAFEVDRGQHYCQLKVLFPREGSRGAAQARIRIRTTDQPHSERKFGRDFKLEGASSPASRKLAATDAAALAKTRGIAPDVLAHARAALEAEKNRIGLANSSATKILLEDGKAGFQALLTLVECGESHHRLPELLTAIWDSDYHAALIGLAEKAGTLANYAGWSLLEAVGEVAGDRGQAFLMKRLKLEKNPGLFMSVAKGLGRRKAKPAAPLIGAQLLRFEAQWKGVERHLLQSLEAMGGRRAIEVLERYAVAEKAAAPKRALRALERLDPAAAKRAREVIEQRK